jgi:hypothetical protein
MQTLENPTQTKKEVVRVCIGTEPKTKIPCKVLRYSIEKHLNPNFVIEFHEMMGNSWSSRNKAKLGSGTGFSLFRWYIPEYFMYQGKAIYLDVDMLCFTDIAEFWLIDETSRANKHGKRASVFCTFQKDKWFSRAPATSAMLIDCELALEDWQYNSAASIEAYLAGDTNRERYIKLMHAQHCANVKEIPLRWNRFNEYLSGDTSILHYTIEPQQPWYFPAHSNKDLWRDYLLETIDLGIVTKEEIRNEVAIFKPHTKTTRGQGLNPYWAKFAN